MERETTYVSVSFHGLPMENTSATLLERLRDPGDSEARTRLVELYLPLLFSWAKRRFELQEQDAADLVQDVFTVLFEKLPAFAYDQRRRFRGWLWTLTRHRFLTGRRRDAVAQQAAAELARRLPEELDSNPVEDEEYRRYIVQRAAALLRSEFEETTWQAFWQCLVEERPAEAVAQELGLSVGAVYTAKSRVLRRLRQEFAGLMD
jgi:RNA polymerase sigma factor (sigma-70 family)